jgi:plasmid stabilization system protein ParE
MKIVFLPSTRSDLQWFRQYYEKIFPEGARGAGEQYRRTIASLRDNPEIGRSVPDADYRVFPVLRTPFSFVYRIANGRIEVLRVRDGRADE